MCEEGCDKNKKGVGGIKSPKKSVLPSEGSAAIDYVELLAGKILIGPPLLKTTGTAPGTT